MQLENSNESFKWLGFGSRKSVVKIVRYAERAC